MFTSNGKSVVTASLDRTCRIWNPKDGTCRHNFQGYRFHESGIISMDVHHDKPLVATGWLVLSLSFAFCGCWDAARSPGLMSAIYFTFMSAVYSQYTPSRPALCFLLTGALDGSVRLSQMRKGKILYALDQENVKQVSSGTCRIAVEWSGLGRGRKHSGERHERGRAIGFLQL